MKISLELEQRIVNALRKELENDVLIPDIGISISKDLGQLKIEVYDSSDYLDDDDEKDEEIEALEDEIDVLEDNIEILEYEIEKKDQYISLLESKIKSI